jgi:molybdate transport system substrate-binding protein
LPLRLLSILLLATLSPASSVGAAPVKLYAASSLTEAINAVADAYAATGHERPVVVLAGSQALARQIIAGAPAGLFISADSQWMDAVMQAGALVPGSRRDIAGNRLVLVVPADRRRPMRSVRPVRSVRLVPGFDLAGFVGTGRWTTGDPDSVPVGRYARAALQRLGAWEAAAPKLARAENVRSALAFVERGDVAAGIVYATDARASTRVVVAGVFPAASHPPIRYPAALVRAGDSADARALLVFVAGLRGAAILQAKGFTPP